MAKKCLYCDDLLKNPYSIKIGDLMSDFCNAGCSNRATAFFKYMKRAKIFFYMLIIIAIMLVLSSIVFAMLENTQKTVLLLLFGVFLSGLTMCIFPFATPESIQGLGIRRSKHIVRTFGVIFLLITVPILIFIL